MYYPFTQKYDGIVNSIESVCGVCMDVEQDERRENPYYPKVEYYRAQWDTGAINTVITPRIVDELGLVSVDCIDNYTAGGVVKSFIYRVNVILPNNVRISSIKAACCDLMDIDMLLGMDVIMMGDMALSGAGGNTTFSFRIPAVEATDFERK